MHTVGSATAIFGILTEYEYRSMAVAITAAHTRYGLAWMQGGRPMLPPGALACARATRGGRPAWEPQACGGLRPHPFAQLSRRSGPGQGRARGRSLGAGFCVERQEDPSDAAGPRAAPDQTPGPSTRNGIRRNAAGRAAHRPTMARVSAEPCRSHKPERGVDSSRTPRGSVQRDWTLIDDVVDRIDDAQAAADGSRELEVAQFRQHALDGTAVR